MWAKMIYNHWSRLFCNIYPETTIISNEAGDTLYIANQNQYTVCTALGAGLGCPTVHQTMSKIQVLVQAGHSAYLRTPNGATCTQSIWSDTQLGAGSTIGCLVHHRISRPADWDRLLALGAPHFKLVLQSAIIHQLYPPLLLRQV